MQVLNSTVASPQDFVSLPILELFSSFSSTTTPSTSQTTTSLLVLDTSITPAVPVPLKIGDIDQDGFPDILAIVSSGTSSHSSRTPRLLTSVPCARGLPGCDANGRGHRGWKVLEKGGEVLGRVGDARGVAFLDTDEDVSGLL